MANKVVGYYASWAHYRNGDEKYTVQDIPVERFTHLIYAFAVLDERTLTMKPHDSHLDTEGNYGVNNYRKFTQLRCRNLGAKFLLALGGWTDSQNDKYSRLALNPHHRANFITHAIQFLKTYGFDGLDFDWEYPSNQQDKTGCAQLLREMSNAFKPFGLLLTAAVPAGRSIIDQGYDVPVLGMYLDQVHLMTYDMHRVRHHAPLYPAPGTNAELSVDSAVQYWLQKGTPAAKLILGVPLYGQCWKRCGSMMEGGGTLAYYKVCQAQQAGWRKGSADDGPQLTDGNQWVGYDDVTAVKKKAQYARANNLGGVMLWDITMDDFRGISGDGVNPIIEAVSRTMGGGE